MVSSIMPHRQSQHTRRSDNRSCGGIEWQRSLKSTVGGSTHVNRSLLLILASSLAGALHAQSPLVAENRPAYNNIKNNLMKAADKMPEDAYSFKPTPDVQSFGERVAHVAGQMGTCSSLTGERK